MQRRWWSSTSATTVAGADRSTGSAGRALAIRISSWTRGDRAACGDRVTHPIRETRVSRGAEASSREGLSHPKDHYYSRLFIDAARAVEATRTIDSVADRPVVVCGGSQGGALALAAASLSQQASVVLPDVPFLSDFRRAVAITDAAPFSEIRDYCATYPDRVGSVFRTLSYFDVVNHAMRVTSPSLFSVALMDEITPPSTVFAAYNNLAGERRIEVYEFNGHEGGGSVHFEKQVGFVREHLG